MDSRAAPDWATFHDPSGKYTLKHQGAYPVVEVRVNQAGAHHPLVQQQPGCVCGMPTDAMFMSVGNASCAGRRRRPVQAAANPEAPGEAIILGGGRGWLQLRNATACVQDDLFGRLAPVSRAVTRWWNRSRFVPCKNGLDHSALSSTAPSHMSANP